MSLGLARTTYDTLSQNQDKNKQKIKQTGKLVQYHFPHRSKILIEVFTNESIASAIFVIMMPILRLVIEWMTDYKAFQRLLKNKNRGWQ